MDHRKLKQYRETFPSRSDVASDTPDPTTRALLARTKELGIETAFDRFDAQKPQCGYGLEGVCCKNCNMGPCRVSEKAPRGVCGADADLIVARNLLRTVAAGVAAHGARGRDAMLALRAAGRGEVALPIRGEEKVRKVASALNLRTEGRPLGDIAAELADVLLEDLSRSVPAPHRTLAALAPPERREAWTRLGVLPISAYHEVFEALHRTGVGTDGDYRNVLKQLLRCGLAFSFSSVLGSSIATDALYGPPRRSEVTFDWAALKDRTVNIAVHGHSPVLVDAIVRASRSDALLDQAQAAGATGIRLYGICCSGLSALYRQGGVTPLSNALGAELVLATGALDAWVADLQDVFPSIVEVADCFGTQIITTHDSGRLPGTLHLGLSPDLSDLKDLDRIATTIVGAGIGRYGRREGHSRFVPEGRMQMEVGFSMENLTEHFGGAAHFASWIRSGEIRGIVNLVGCNNPKVPYERAIRDVAEHLIRNDILVLTNGCASFPLLKLGFCTPAALERAGSGLQKALSSGTSRLPPVLQMGECLDNARASALFRALSDAFGAALPHLPFAFASPEWSNEKGVGAALSFRLLGLNSYHCVYPQVLGSENVERFLYHDTEDTLGSVMVVDPDPKSLAVRIVSDLNRRRAKFGLVVPPSL